MTDRYDDIIFLGLKPQIERHYGITAFITSKT